MTDENKPVPEEEKGTEQQTGEKAETAKPDEVNVPEEKPEDSEPEAEKADESEGQQEKPAGESTEFQADSTAQIEELRAENVRLKTQLAARDIGFLAEVSDDAVMLAQGIAERDGTDVSEALKAVAKKYPSWTKAAESNSTKGGFRLGADGNGGTADDSEEKLSRIFGIRKKR